MKKGLTLFALCLCLFACSGGMSGGESSEQESLSLTAIQGTTSSDLDNYDQENNYCDYILFHKTEALILIDYNFFPSGTDVCQQVTYDAELNPDGACKTAKTVVLPCGLEGISAEDNDLLEISVSAPAEATACEDQLVLDLSSAEFTIDGLVLPFSSSLDVFANDLGFKITQISITNASTGEALSFGSKDFGLEEIVSTISQ